MSDTPAFHDAIGKTIRHIRESTEALGVSLPLPSRLTSSPIPLKTVKEFCVGLLENPVAHPWGKHTAHLDLATRTTIAGTLFLTRKMLPTLPASSDAHKLKMSTPTAPPPERYLDFVRKTIGKMFPKGWDARYEGYVSRHLPSSSSSLESTRATGGTRGYFVSPDGDSDWDMDSSISGARYQVAAMAHGENLPHNFKVRYQSVECDGKSRGVTIASASQTALAPLHRMIYDRLSRCGWLLRGDANARKLDIPTKEGEVFVSGDYESATDNLPISVAETILHTLRSRSTHVPDSVWRYALASNRALIWYPCEHKRCSSTDTGIHWWGSCGSVVQQARGQLMGNFLSFPLLCLQNYLAFRYLIPDQGTPVKINGDDIVFRTNRETAKKWMDGVGELGLTLSRGKTLVHGSIFSLNSTFFHSNRRRTRLVPTIRPACLARRPSPDALCPSFHSYSRGFKGVTKEKVQGLFLRWRAPQIKALGRSLRRDLGFRVSNAALQHGKLLGFEGEMLLAHPIRNPLPITRTPIRGLGIPPGWRLSAPPAGTDKSQHQAWTNELRMQMTTSAWATIPLPPSEELDEAWSKCVGTGHFWWLKKRAYWRRIGRCRAKGSPYVEFARRMRSSYDVATSYAPSSFLSRGKRVWVPDWAVERCWGGKGKVWGPEAPAGVILTDHLYMGPPSTYVRFVGPPVEYTPLTSPLDK